MTADVSQDYFNRGSNKMAQIIDGKKISADIKEELKGKVAQLKEQGIEGTLAVIQVGDDPASSVYVRNKKEPANTLESGQHLLSCRKRPRRKSFWH